MKLLNVKQTLKAKTLGLALAAFLIPAGIASANVAAHPVVVQKNLSGHVEVVKQVPGGTVTVGVQIGKPRPQVVVVREQPKVIVVEKQRGRGYEERREYDRRDRHDDRGYRGHERREVTVIHQEPRRQVTIVKTVPAHREVTIVKTVPARREVVVVKNDRGYDRDGHQRIEYRK